MSTETLRPNAAGDSTQFTPYPNTGEANWEDVDEETADNDTTYVYNSTTPAKTDVYNLTPHTGSGTINSVTVYAVAKKTGGTGNNITIVIRTGGTNYNGATGAQSLTTSYATYSDSWATNPKSGNPWSWDDIDALQAGCTLSYKIGYQNRCTQVYVVVDYTPPPAVKPRYGFVNFQDPGIL